MDSGQGWPSQLRRGPEVGMGGCGHTRGLDWAEGGGKGTGWRQPQTALNAFEGPGLRPGGQEFLSGIFEQCFGRQWVPRSQWRRRCCGRSRPELVVMEVRPCTGKGGFPGGLQDTKKKKDLCLHRILAPEGTGVGSLIVKRPGSNHSSLLTSWRILMSP